MMSLWGKLTKPSINSEEADEKYYFTTSTGQIVSADGSGYVIPAIADEAVDKADYIPLDFAQSKVKDMADESIRLREAYQKHLTELDVYYRKSMSDTKTHYETLIKDLKAKALRHVEIRKQLQLQSETKLKDELKVSEDSVEELRDSMASLNREYQEEVRSLKTSINESARAAEKMKKEIETLQSNEDHIEAEAEARHTAEVDCREACRGALLGILHKVEIKTLREQLRKLQGEQKLVAQLQAEVLSLDAKNRTCQEQLEQADRDREEAAALQEQNLRDVAALQEEHSAEVGRLKEKFSGQMKAAKQQYLTKLKQLQGKLQRAEVQVCLTALVGQVVDQHSSGLVTELKGSYSASSLQHAHQEEQLVQQYEDQLAAQRQRFEEQHQALKKKFTAKMQAAGDRIKRSEVQLCVRDLVLAVVERGAVPLLTPGTVPARVSAPASPRSPRAQPAPASVPATPAMIDIGVANVSSSEHAALLEKVQQLEEQAALQQQEFERQLDEARKAAPQPSSELVPNSASLLAQEQAQQCTPQGDAAASAAAAAAGPTSEQLTWQAQLSALKKQEAALRPEAAQSTSALKQCTAELDALNEEKEACKNDIKDWSRAFVEANGREPNVQDKATVKDKYQKYKVLSAKVKDLEGKLDSCKQTDTEKAAALKDVQQQIERLTKLLAGAGGGTAGAAAGDTAAGQPMRPVVETSDAEMQTEDTRGGMLRRANTQKLLEGASAKQKLSGDKLRIAELEEARDADSLTIEQLDDQLYQLRQDWEKAVSDKEKLEKEQAFLLSQVDGLIKEKRTDVVKRYEEEIERLNQSQSALNDKIAALTATKVSNEARMTELQSRVDIAEGELKERDAKELQGLEPKDEKALLKGQISKQREQIILKAKAATAGWDAAAHSDERLDVEVERAFKKGFAEERKKHIDDMAALNAAIEVKETRITEMLVAMAEMERKVMKSDALVADMTKQTEAMKLEVADTIASLSMMAMSGGGGGGGGGGEDGEGMMGPTAAELDAAREQLDVAQEELVGLMERCDRLDQELEVARRKNRVYEELAALTGLNNADLAMKKAKANGGGATAQKSTGSKGPGPANSIYDSNEAINIIKKAVLKGTGLWKSNRKDDCFDVYADACQDCLNRLLSADLRSGLADAISNGKTLAVQNKQRGAVVVRKALDKLLSDLERPNIKKAEDEAVASLRGQAAEAQEAEDGQTSDHVNELVEELNQIESSFLEQGYTKERNPSNSSSTGNAEASPRPDNSAGSLLARAKNAEAMVATLKKQLAAVVAATAARSADASAPTAGAAAGGTGASALAARRPVAGAAVGGADPTEVRKLNRKIKDLEAQIKSGAGAGAGGSVASADMKALQQNEKVLQKKLKDAENNFKRDSKGIEMRAVKAENALQKIEATYTSVVSERDKLKTENAKLSGLTSELATLKAKTEYFLQVEVQLDTKTKEYDILAEQFKKETTLRKKYKNELEDLKGAIRVYARCRPMARYEIEKGCKSVVEIKDETSLKVITSRGDKDFEFDAVFSDQSTQDQVFEDTKRLVESCMDGFNVCLFAYGQTGSGKTFTMTGSPSMPGLTPKAIDELFRLIDERVHLNVRVTTYFVELYNDNLVDLYWVLDNKGKGGNPEPPKLDIKMDAKKMVYIRNAVIKDATSPAELMDLFNSGNVERHTGATKMNAESSRSHSIFAIMVDCYDTATKRTTTGKLSLVDLAGSERADKTGAAAERLKEAQNINKSLSALGDVIAALSEGNKFVPYRNNKLTQLMQDSLGGNAKTLMFVNFSPADYNSDETSTSLMYAARVKKIVNNASKQAESEEVARLKHIIKRLQAGQPVEDAAAMEEEEPPPAAAAADDGKNYDGY